jgi:hypothetical protein
MRAPEARERGYLHQHDRLVPWTAGQQIPEAEAVRTALDALQPPFYHADNEALGTQELHRSCYRCHLVLPLKQAGSAALLGTVAVLTALAVLLAFSGPAVLLGQFRRICGHDDAARRQSPKLRQDGACPRMALLVRVTWHQIFDHCVQPLVSKCRSAVSAVPAVVWEG